MLQPHPLDANVLEHVVRRDFAVAATEIDADVRWPDVGAGPVNKRVAVTQKTPPSAVPACQRSRLSGATIQGAVPIRRAPQVASQRLLRSCD